MLERFSTARRPGGGEGGRGGRSIGDETLRSGLASVIANLNNILNTKKGFGSYVREFGIGDYNAHRARPKIVESIIREFTENIRLFEPRVKLDKIREVESDTPFRIRFEVKCLFLDAAKPLYIIIDSLRNDVMVEEA